MSFEDERSPTLSEVLRNAMASNQRDLYTMLPGKIVSFDGAKRSATVQPLIRNTFKTVLGTEVKEDLPQVQNVPVLFAEGVTASGAKIGSGFSMAEGAFVMLLFAQRRLDEYLASDGRMSDPGSFEMHDINDVVAMPGMGPYSERPSQTIEDDEIFWGFDNGTQVHIREGKLHLGRKDAQYKATVDEKLQAELDKIHKQLAAISAWQTAVLAGVVTAAAAGAAALTTVPTPPSAFTVAYTTSLTTVFAANTPPVPPTKGTTNSDVVKLD